MYSVEYYKKENGEVPCREFIESLSLKMQVKAMRSIELLEQYGIELREPYSKYLEEGIFELRIRFSSDIVRVFYFFLKEEKIILTNGFVKKTNKTPVRYLREAKKYKKDFENGIGGIADE